MKLEFKVSKPSAKTWTVKGADLDEVFEGLEKHGPWALYEGNPSISAKIKKGDVESVKLTAKPAITMPVWSGYSKARDEEKASWDAMWKQLEAHEAEHHDILVEHIGKLADWIRKQDTLDKKALDSAYGDFEKKYHAAQKSFDGSHGCSAELVIPPPAEPAE